MLTETLPSLKPEAESPLSTDDLSPTPTNTQPLTQPNDTPQLPQGSTTDQFPPPKTDKPRPHVCTTCNRSFARLEHLKRHERSHTKEKPFECPECTRCFARRDLLLRHQQKLHLTSATARQRNGRRESVSSNATAALNNRGRKSSIATSVSSANGVLGANGARPRANTLSHLDIPPLGPIEGADGGLSRVHTHNLVFSPHTGMMHPASGPVDFNYHGMPHMLGPHGLSKLDTHMANMDMSNALHTAPPYANAPGFDAELAISQSRTTINPAALHFGGSGPAAGTIPFGYNISVNQQGPMPDVDELGWMNDWNVQMMPGQDLGDQVIDESSPSRVSSGDSPETFDESLNNSHMGLPISNTFGWQHEPQAHQQQSQQHTMHPYAMDALGSGLPTTDVAGARLSPNIMHDPNAATDAFLHRGVIHPSSGQQHHQPANVMSHHQLHQHQQMHPEMTNPQAAPFIASTAFSHLSSNSPSVASSTMTGSARHSSVTSVSTDSITESTRQALLVSLSQASGLGAHSHRVQAVPSTSSPLSPGSARPAQQSNSPSLPSTDDLRRYLDAFIQFALPHLPVVHLPTLAFDTFAKGFESCFTSRGSAIASSFTPNAPASASVGGARCLILGMAAIGALYEYDHQASKDLFEAAKKLISLYLEERRKADMSAAVNGSSEANEPPLWLVQAMLLTVIYGHHCGDKLTADIASNQIAALVSLSRAANLNRVSNAQDQTEGDLTMSDGPDGEQNNDELQVQWMRWKKQEERKRLFFAIFTISSLLTMAYNHTPCIMNSEIHLDLPCQEPLWNAESAQEWQELGGQALINQTSIPFATALSTLLTANKRHSQSDANQSAFNISNPLAALQTAAGDNECELQPGTFGCYVLIHALHNYIWETRSRHRGREWTAQETEVMVSHIEPALKVWQAAWKATNYHKLERPNPFGLGPMAADSIPLLDLAFVKLFVNLSRTAEAFWRRDFDAMAEELAKGGEVILAGTPSERKNPFDARRNGNSPNGRSMDVQLSHSAASVRESSLRKAALYAADSMAISCTFNLTYADPAAHELPIQSAICFLDCAQVLSEWCTTVQERVGSFLGIIGRDAIDFTQVPAIMLLETEDVELLRKIEQICNNLENKRHQQENLLAIDIQQMNPSAHPSALRNNVDLATCAIGSRILRITAMMLEKAVIWPITHVMGHALEVQATYMDRRVDASIVTQ